MHQQIHHIISCLTLIVLTGCADQISNAPINYCEAGDYQNCALKTDAGDCPESFGCTHPVSETRDTYEGAFDGNQAANAGSYKDGYAGQIDPGCRLLDEKRYGADMDWIAIEAIPGTPLKVMISHAASSRISPMAYLRTSVGNELLYARPDRSDNASLEFLAPESKFYITVEEAANYALNYQKTCNDSATSGGDAYQYVVRVSNSEMEIEDLGEVKSGIIHRDKLAFSGQSRYYRITTTAPGGIDIILRPEKDNEGYMPVISPLIRNPEHPNYGDGYQWALYGAKLDHYSQTKTLEEAYHWTFDREYASCAENKCEYWLVVSDYDASSGYQYELNITQE